MQRKNNYFSLQYHWKNLTEPQNELLTFCFVLFSTSVKITEKTDNLKKRAPSEKMYGFEYCNFQIKFRFIKKPKPIKTHKKNPQTTALLRFYTF